MKIPNEHDVKRAMTIRCASKGQYIGNSDIEFLVSISKKFTDWYAATEHEVFNTTVPFGSNVKMEPPKP